jgi:hypothetical protein
VTGQEFNIDRVFRLVMHTKMLKKAYLKRHDEKEVNEATLHSIFNALIVGDQQLMKLYEKTL